MVHNTVGSIQLTSSHWLEVTLLSSSVSEVLWSLTDTVEVAEEVDSGALNSLLDKLALALVLPEGVHEARLAVGAVVRAHDLADGVGGLLGVVEWDSGHQVVENVGANDIVEKMGINEAKVTVDGGGGATGEVPGVVIVVWEGAVGVLEEGDGNYKRG